MTLLPPNATELERNLATVMARTGDLPMPLRDLHTPAVSPLAALPWLAWENSVDQWDPTWTEVQRRAVIAASNEVHRTKGTAGSVRSAVAALGMSATIYEWWQETPRAAPYTFRVEIDDVGVPPALLQSVERQITAVKPVRAHFTMQLIARPKVTLFLALSVQDLVTTTIYPKPA